MKCPSTLVPAYGRDYQSLAAAKADFDAGKDFIIADIFHPFDQKPVGKPGLISSYGHGRVQLRYGKLRKSAIVEF